MSVSFECKSYEAEPDYPYYWPDATYHPDECGASDVFSPCDSEAGRYDEIYYWPEYVSHENEILQSLIALCDRQVDVPGHLRMWLMPSIKQAIEEADADELTIAAALAAVQAGEDLCALLPEEDAPSDLELLAKKFARIARRVEKWLRRTKKAKASNAQLKLL